MDRRDFLKQAGIASVASASLLGALADPAKADAGQIAFHFAGLGYDTANPTGDQLIMAGGGRFNPSGSAAEGGGCYQRYNTGAPGFPKPILEAGSWRAGRLISWTPVPGNNPYGVTAAGIAVMSVRLSPVGAPAYPATLKIVCNIP